MLYINENIPCRPLNQHSKIADLKLNFIKVSVNGFF